MIEINEKMVRPIVKIIDTDNPISYLNDKIDNPQKLISVAVKNMCQNKFSGKQIIPELWEEMRIYERDCFLWFVNRGLI
jgi:hypothetical protein